MKNIKILLLLYTTSCFLSCVNDVKLDLKTGPTRLVVEASIVWDKEEAGNNQSIKLSTTTGFYEEKTPAVSNAQVFIQATDGRIFNFVEDEFKQGQYNCNDFVPVINGTYKLTIIYNNETYTATETLRATPPFDYAEQIKYNSDDGDGEIRAYFTDPNGTDNYYLAEGKYNGFDLLPDNSYSLLNNRFSNGNQMYYVYKTFLTKGKSYDFKLISISKNNYDYLRKLLSINNLNPFLPPSGPVRGNIINITNPDYYCLGFFRLSEVSNLKYIIQ